jgi:hypothetical protein
VRPRKRGERITEWRKKVPIRAIAFEPPRLPDGRDAPEIVQVHLEHRLVRRLLSRFLSQRAARRHDDELQKFTHCSSSGRSIFAAIRRALTVWR